jgi:hypothetical protein
MNTIGNYNVSLYLVYTFPVVLHGRNLLIPNKKENEIHC